MAEYLQGKFQPKNPKKYKGNIDKIFFRSSYEMKYMKYLDEEAAVLQWASEEIAIEYISVDNKKHRYFPDFWIKVLGKDGKITQYIVEIKPHVQTIPPNMKRKKTKRLMEDILTYEINKAKWKAAEQFCNKYNMVFVKLTEKELFSKAK